MVSETDVDVVIAGHFGFAEDHTPEGCAVNLGGSGYACGVGATAGRPDRVGVVAYIGEDFDVDALKHLGVDCTGAVVVPGRAPHLTITQHSPTDRSFKSDLGVAATPAVGAFPNEYATTRHLHIGTMPPHEQRAWLELAHTLDHCTTSVDMFEPTAMESPEECRDLCYSADLTFMNEQECRLLFTGHPLPSGDIVLKKGPGGAAIRSRGAWTHVPAAPRRAVDSTGAGELLAGAFLSLRAMGLTVDVALRYAVRAASAKVVEFGVDGENLHRALAQIRSAAAGGGGESLTW